MFISDFSIKRPISVSMIVLGILLLGIVSIGGMPVSLLPDITFPRVTVRTEYPQAAPGEVETIVTRPIEQVLGILNNVVKITSISKSGLSDVVVEFGWGTDLDVVTMDIREKLQLLQFPDDVKKPLILRYDPSQDPVMTIAVTADLGLSDLRYMVEQNIQRELERIDGVAAVRVQGGYEEQILVSLDERKMSAFGITVSEIVDRLKRENINVAGGTLKDAGAELSVRTSNAFKNLDEIKNLVLKKSGSTISAGVGGVPGGEGLESNSLLEMLGFLSGGASLSIPSSMPSTALPMSTSTGGGEVRLKDIARVERKPKQRTEIARLNGKECIQVSVYKEGDANVVSVCRDLRRELKRIKASLRREGAIEPPPDWSEIWDTFRRSPAKGPQLVWKKLKGKDAGNEETWKLLSNMNISTIYDEAVFIENAISQVYSSALWGALIAVAVIYFFLRSFKATAIIGIAIPVSIIATFNLMYFFGISWNVMSLGGLALGVGILVDNSIVVLENIYRLRELRTGDLQETAAKGASQVATAVTASTLTNIVVFFPIVFVVGIASQIFKDLALTVAFSMILSELTAFTIVPTMTVAIKLGAESKDSGFEIGGKPKGALEKTAWLIGRVYKSAAGTSSLLFSPLLTGFDKAFAKMKEIYPKVLAWTIERPKQTVSASLLISALSVVLILLMGMELLPNVDQGQFYIQMKMATGTPIEETDKKTNSVEKIFNSVADSLYIKNLFSAVGYGTRRTEGVQLKSENFAEILVTLKDNRTMGDFEVMDALRARMTEVLTGAEVKMSRPALLTYRAPIEIEVVGNNIEELKRTADKIAEAISDIRGIFDVESTGREANPEIQITVDRDKAARYGLTVAQVVDTVRKKVKGEKATDLDEGERQIEIIVQAREEDRRSIEEISNLAVPRPIGEPVPLKLVADIKPALGPGVIYRSGNSRVALVTADISDRALGDVVKDINKKLDKIALRPGYFTRITGQNEEMKKSLRSLLGATLLAGVLVYIVLASLFESLIHPFVIMFTIPFSLVGVALIMAVTGVTLNVFTFIGIMMMIGIAVNDAIIFVELTNQNRREGMDKHNALLAAGKDRLRPILITTLTTVLGMIPMAVISGEGAELRAPIAIAVIGGLSASTLFTLISIPSVYLLLDKLRPGGGEKPPKTAADFDFKDT